MARTQFGSMLFPLSSALDHGEIIADPVGILESLLFGKIQDSKWTRIARRQVIEETVELLRRAGPMLWVLSAD